MRKTQRTTPPYRRDTFPRQSVYKSRKPVMDLFSPQTLKVGLMLP